MTQPTIYLICSTKTLLWKQDSWKPELCLKSWGLYLPCSKTERLEEVNLSAGHLSYLSRTLSLHKFDACSYTTNSYVHVCTPFTHNSDLTTSLHSLMPLSRDSIPVNPELTRHLVSIMFQRVLERPMLCCNYTSFAVRALKRN